MFHSFLWNVILQIIDDVNQNLALTGGGRPRGTARVSFSSARRFRTVPEKLCMKALVAAVTVGQ